MALKAGLEEYNPALYEYNSEERFNEVFDSLYNSMDDTSWLSFFRVASRLGAEMNEGHLTIGSSKAPFRRGFADGSFKYMPLGMSIAGDSLFLWKHVTEDTTFRQGDRIISINGKTAEEIVAQLGDYILTDGHIKTARNHTIRNLFTWLYFWYIEQPDSFSLKFQSPGSNEIKEVVLPALTHKEVGEAARKKFPPKAEEAESGDKFHIKEIVDKTAYLKLKSFDWRIVEEYQLDADKFYEDFFRDLKAQSVDYLIVDLRGNRGGRKEFANSMIPCINKAGFTGKYFESIKYSGGVTEYETPENSQYFFDGKIFVITDGGTFSSGTSLAVFLKELGHAIVVGEETGGRYEGFVAGSSEEVTLPNSGAKVYIPRYNMVNLTAISQKTSNRGLLPDHEVTYTPEEKISGIDKERKLIDSLIVEMKNRK
ncbi:MAG: peptidase S41 [Melioribacteraceae bacterium]|nr:MAG: peptidase S41 [Melioribacteraceae bacterium]